MVVNAWHNGEALDYNLVNCFDGFFVQINVACGRTLLDNLVAAAPIVSLGMHQEVFVLPDPLLVQVTAYVPGGDTLMSSRALTVIYQRDQFFSPSRWSCAAVSLTWSMCLTSWAYSPSV